MKEVNPLITIIAVLLTFFFNHNIFAEFAYSKVNNANLRMQATKYSGRICSFSTGEKVEIKWPSGSWYFVQSVNSKSCKRKKGYIHKSLLDFKKVERLESSKVESQLVFARKNGASLRMQASSNSGKICSFNIGEKVNIKWESGSWYFVKSLNSQNCKTKQGYVHKSMISSENPIDATINEKPETKVTSTIESQDENTPKSNTEDLSDDIREEDHAHEDEDKELSESEFAPVTSMRPISRQSIIENRIEELENYNFEIKNFRFIITKKSMILSNLSSKEENVLCRLETGVRINLAGAVGLKYGYTKVEDENSSCDGMMGFVELVNLAKNNLRYINKSKVHLRKTPNSDSHSNTICHLDNTSEVTFIENTNDKWSKVSVNSELIKSCLESTGYVRTKYLSTKENFEDGTICGDSRISNISSNRWGKQKIGTEWVAMWNEKFCPALRDMANEFGGVKIVSGVRPYSENIARNGANCSKHRLRWNKDGRHLGCGRGKDLGTLGGAIDILLPGVFGNGGCGSGPAVRSQRRAYSFIRKYTSFRVNVYKSGRIHLGLLPSKGSSRVPYSTCVY